MCALYAIIESEIGSAHYFSENPILCRTSHSLKRRFKSTVQNIKTRLRASRGKGSNPMEYFHETGVCKIRLPYDVLWSCPNLTSHKGYGGVKNNDRPELFFNLSMVLKRLWGDYIQLSLKIVREF